MIIWRRSIKSLFKTTQQISKSFSSTTKQPFEVSYIDGDVFLNPKDTAPRNTLIWLHGKGESGKTYVPLFNCENSVVPLDMRIVLPNAPERKVSGKSRETLNSWYDIDLSAYGRGLENMEHILWSGQYLMDTVEMEAEKMGHDLEKVFLGGFSQGCALALWIFLRCKKDFGGFFGFSGHLFDFAEVKEGTKRDIPIFLYHGDNDETIPLNYAMSTYKRLKDNNMNVKILAEKGLGHRISPEGEDCMKYFFHKLLEQSDY